MILHSFAEYCLSMASKYNRQDHLYHKAKEEGYQSRAAYKLIELQERFSLFGKNAAVLDLGAWPGGWSEVALKQLGPAGCVVGIDLQAIETIGDPRFHFVHGDARDDANLDLCLDYAKSKFDAVISDMSPKLTGIKEADQSATVGCAELALYISCRLLKPGGNFVVKVFKGGDVESFIRGARPMFTKVTRAELKSTRSTSNEFYVVGLGFKNA